MALALGLDDSTLVPPLELAGGDAGQGDYVVRWKAVLHCFRLCLKQSAR
jgi:hypothetical protein